jgi:hypothetical protein
MENCLVNIKQKGSGEIVICVVRPGERLSGEMIGEERTLEENWLKQRSTCGHTSKGFLCYTRYVIEKCGYKAL